MKFVVSTNITKEYLLEKYTQETYLSHYLNIPVKKGLFKSPLRADKKPTCSFYVSKKGDVMFKDFGDNFSGDFVAVVQKIHNCNYQKALNIIASDFNLTNKTPNSTKINIVEQEAFVKNNETIINVKIKDFSKDELDWWEQYGITIDILNKFNVFSCDTVFLNGQVFGFSNKNNYMFGYYRKDLELERWRIYMPLKKTYRFIANWKQTMLQGGKQLEPYGDFIVITKSLKDVMTLYSLGIAAVAPCSENLFITKDQFNGLKKRYKDIILFYDTDLPGIKSMNKIRKNFDVICTWIPRKYNIKDISDFYKIHGKTETISLIQSFNFGRTN